jgi:hypothetical protein
MSEERTSRAWLEGTIVTSSAGVEGLDRAENGIDIQSGTTIIGQVRDDRTSVPEILEEAK